MAAVCLGEWRLHSPVVVQAPVTAGVLRGNRARFQLFGDTMNTAARMQTTGQRDKIYISAETAELLRVTRREIAGSNPGKMSSLQRAKVHLVNGKACLTRSSPID
jgi:class 3 adenylate cyclase